MRRSPYRSALIVVASVMVASGVTTAVVEPAAAAPAGGLATWGGGGLGQRGDGTNTSGLTATSVLSSGVLAGKQVVQVDAGGAHACAVTADGLLACWGYNAFGQLGNGTTADSNVPVAVTGGALAGHKVTRVSAGSTHTCAITDQGKVACWGRNTFGQLGDLTKTDAQLPVAVYDGHSSGLYQQTATDISAGSVSTCAVAGGHVTCWGANDSGQLGTGSTTPLTAPSDFLLGAIKYATVTRVSVGGAHACAVTSIGRVACWGSNSDGQLGVTSGLTTCGTTPCSVYSWEVQGPLVGRTVTQVSSGARSTCAATSQGPPFCWGDNVVGQLGDGTLNDRTQPVAVYADSGPLAGATVTQVDVSLASGTDSHACAVTDTGVVACWGSNAQSQIGLTTILPCAGTPCARLPLAVTGGPYPGSGVMAGARGLEVSAGGGFSAALTATVPGAPTGLAASPGDGAASLTWTPPSSNGGSAIKQYEVQKSVDGGSSWTAAATVAGGAPTVAVTALTNGVAVVFRVSAWNAIGQGPWSAPSAAVVPAGALGPPPAAVVPDAPTGLTATAGNAQAVLSWAAPASDGGQPVTGYPIEQSTDGGTTWTVAAGSPAGAGATTATVTGLANGTAVTFRVAATNTVGTGAWSTPSNTVTPTAPVVVSKPGKVVNLKAVNKRVRKAVLTWGTPTTGGIATAYQYRWKLKGKKYNSWRTTTNTKKAITKLKRGKTYVFNVRATNTAGPGPTATKSLKIRR